jgi:lycopene cyclase domain-containing protein
MMLIFIPWDVIFTAKGYWGFNPDYLIGTYIFGLPIEEWLFFICIPYACIFTHYALLTIWPQLGVSDRTVSVIYVLLLSILIVVLWYYYDRWYTFICFVYGIITLSVVYNYKRSILNSFLLTYLVILIPFFIVNGVLTGTGIEDQVVWYNNSENLGIRMVTIPIEDTIYNLGMLLTVFAITEALESRKKDHT